MITPALCRAARSYLNWSQTRLADESRLARQTVVVFEGNKGITTFGNRLLLEKVFESAGIEFFGGEGEPQGFRVLKAELWEDPNKEKIDFLIDRDATGDKPKKRAKKSDSTSDGGK